MSKVKHSFSNQSTNAFFPRLKMVVIGDASVGKTCLLHRFVTGEFYEGYVPTIIENKHTKIRIGRSYVKLELWDTAGQEDYQEMMRLSYHQTDLFVIVFAVDDPKTFANAMDRWYPELKSLLQSKIIFVGNKTDLRTDDGIRSGDHLSKETVKESLKKLECCYFETSALNKEGVDDFFREGAKLCLAEQKDVFIADDEFGGSQNGTPLGCCTSGATCQIF